MEPARAFDRAFRAVQDDVRDYIHAVNPSKPNVDLVLRLERIQQQLAEDLRAGLTDLDPFQREGVIRMTVDAFRKALTTAGLINDRTSMKLAREAVAKVGVVVQARVHDERWAQVRDEAMAQLVEDNVVQWTWKATLDANTCLYCISRHGTTFPVGVPMESHPNCRCIPVPPRTRVGSGERFLARLSKANRRKVMGPRRAELYEAGQVGMSDMVDANKHGVIPLRNLKPDRFEPLMSEQQPTVPRLSPDMPFPLETNQPARWARLGAPNARLIEAVPIDVLQRMAGNEPGKLGKDPVSMAEDIKANGLRAPVIITYDPETERAIVGEGNNRVEAMRLAGYQAAPARVLRGHVDEGRGMKVTPLIHPEEGSHYIPGEMGPSWVGLPTVELEALQQRTVSNMLTATTQKSPSQGLVTRSFGDGYTVTNYSPDVSDEQVDQVTRAFRQAQKGVQAWLREHAEDSNRRTTWNRELKILPSEKKDGKDVDGLWGTKWGECSISIQSVSLSKGYWHQVYVLAHEQLHAFSLKQERLDEPNFRHAKYVEEVPIELIAREIMYTLMDQDPDLQASFLARDPEDGFKGYYAPTVAFYDVMDMLIGENDEDPYHNNVVHFLFQMSPFARLRWFEDLAASEPDLEVRRWKQDEMRNFLKTGDMPMMFDEWQELKNEEPTPAVAG